MRLKGSPQDCAIEQQVCCLLYQVRVEQVDLEELMLLLMESVKWTEINLFGETVDVKLKAKL